MPLPVKMKLNFGTIAVALVVSFPLIADVETLVLLIGFAVLDNVEQDEQFEAALQFAVVVMLVPGYLSVEFALDLLALMVETAHWQKRFAVLQREECLYLETNLHLVED